MKQDEIIEMARQAGFERLGHDDCDLVCYSEELQDFAKLVAAKEREACAYRAGIALLGADRALANRVNKAIRARSEA